MRVWRSGTGVSFHVSPSGQLLSFNVSVGDHRPNVPRLKIDRSQEQQIDDAIELLIWKLDQIYCILFAQ